MFDNISQVRDIKKLNTYPHGSTERTHRWTLLITDRIANGKQDKADRIAAVAFVELDEAAWHDKDGIEAKLVRLVAEKVISKAHAVVAAGMVAA